MAENNPFPGENNTGHIWDDNLRELNNPPPRWWMIAFWLSILFWVGYAILYPMWPAPYQPADGDGYTKGILGWTQMKEYQEGVAQVQEIRAEFEDRIAAMTTEEIMADSGLTQYTLASAKVLFGDYCSACHGSGGQGNPGYPVLADDDWLYGGTVAKLDESVTHGRKGAMTAHQGVLTEAEVDQLANFVVALSEDGGDDGGWALYNAKGCGACHGPNADGVLATLPNGDIISVGAADLTDAIWRFTPGGFESARHTITYGVNQPVEGTRDAVMPAFGDSGRLGEQEIKKLVVYVHKLGGGQ